MSAKFVFYQEVKILNFERIKQYNGMVGIVFGIGEDEGLGYSYAVYFPDKDITASLWETELDATGNYFKQEDFY